MWSPLVPQVDWVSLTNSLKDCTWVHTGFENPVADGWGYCLILPGCNSKMHGVGKRMRNQETAKLYCSGSPGKSVLGSRSA